MIEALSLGFFQRALLAGVMLSLLCGVLSVFVILRRMAFIGVGISHSAFGGVALGFLLGLDPLWSGIGFSLVVALLIEWAQERGRLEQDAAIGIFFAVAMALGVVFLSLSRTYNVDVFGFLFGNILAVGPYQVGETLAVSAVVLGTVTLFYKELVFLSFDEEMAWVSGVPVRALRYLFLVLLALVIIMAIYLVGIILVSALLVIPGAVARNLTRHISGMLWVSVAAAVAATLAGLFLSLALDWPSGATVVLVLGLAFFLSQASRLWPGR
uniref:Metal ABC transporter permease n=1 Tax=Desulfobacca acetoxidans TaxID=60893 RepID=A0A7C3YY14_9BACT